jgi:hypothetical protein
MIMSEGYYSAEQQEQLAERRRALGDGGMAAAELMEYVGMALAQLG